MAFNQEKFIAEAVRGALSQTYSPLEIILSDDCSVDRTYEIIESMAAHYTGPHKIILNRNKSNLGLAGHSNRVTRMAHGELIVGAAGDDVSMPHRTAILYDAWDSIGKKAVYMHSRVIHMDECGNEYLSCSMG